MSNQVVYRLQHAGRVAILKDAVVSWGRWHAAPYNRIRAGAPGLRIQAARRGLARERARSVMKRALIPAVSVLILGLVLIGCGKPVGAQKTPSSGCNGTVQMAASSFVQSSCTVKAGTSVNFVDPQGTGGFHLLCLGAHQQCVSNPDGPAELNVSGGVTFNQGDSHSYVFAKPGTYTVTCTVHPAMDITITVQ